MKDTFTPGSGVKVIQHSVVINVPGKNGRVVPAGKERVEFGTESQEKGSGVFGKLKVDHLAV